MHTKLEQKFLIHNLYEYLEIATARAIALPTNLQEFQVNYLTQR